MTGLWPGPDWFLEPGWGQAQRWLNSSWKNKTCVLTMVCPHLPVLTMVCFSVDSSTLAHKHNHSLGSH